VHGRTGIFSPEESTEMVWNRARTIGFVAAAGIAVGGCGVGATVGRTAAVARLTVVAAAHAATGTTPTIPTFPAPVDATNAATGASAPSAAANQSPAAAAPGAALANRAPAGRAAAAATPASAARSAAGATGAASTGTASGAGSASGVSASAGLAPRRQPTAAQVAQVIAAVHSLVPFFTPSAADVADAGTKVCTAFDQGKSFSAVKSTALDLVGAGSYSWLVPPSVAASAVRSLVNLYCPAYAAKTA
jgi:hypothetical protein